VEGILAQKNFKRNRHRYRATILSLFVSIVLFVSASAFTQYIERGVVDASVTSNYDISFMEVTGAGEEVFRRAYSQLATVEGITALGYSAATTTALLLSPGQMDATYLELRAEQYGSQTWSVPSGTAGAAGGESSIALEARVVYLDDASFETYAAAAGKDAPPAAPAPAAPGKVLAVNEYHVREALTGKYLTGSIFTAPAPLTLHLALPLESMSEPLELTISAFTNVVPPGARDYNDGLLLVCSETTAETLFGPVSPFSTKSATFSAKDPAAAFEQMRSVLARLRVSDAGLYNVAANEVANRNMVFALNVFCNGFIILISLIAIANVFNTISTSINLRRQEFAMLRSVGMGERAFARMMRIECALYGAKALLWGLPVAMLVTYAIFLASNMGVEMAFFLPLDSMAISVGSVFLVIFASMFYAVAKTRRESLVETLRNENL
jgi:putative ABC transport system permease protein